MATMGSTYYLLTLLFQLGASRSAARPAWRSSR